MDNEQTQTTLLNRRVVFPNVIIVPDPTHDTVGITVPANSHGKIVSLHLGEKNSTVYTINVEEKLFDVPACCFKITVPDDEKYDVIVETPEGDKVEEPEHNYKKSVDNLVEKIKEIFPISDSTAVKWGLPTDQEVIDDLSAFNSNNTDKKSDNENPETKKKEPEQQVTPGNYTTFLEGMVEVFGLDKEEIKEDFKKANPDKLHHCPKENLDPPVIEYTKYDFLDI